MFKDEDSNEMFTSVLDGSVTSLTSLLNPYSVYTVVVGYKNNADIDSTVDVFKMNRTLSAGTNFVNVSRSTSCSSISSSFA